MPCKALQPRRLPRRRLRQPRRPDIARRSGTASWSRATSPTWRPSAAALRRHEIFGGHALRGVSRRRRVGARAGRATTATTSVGALSVLEAMAAESVRHFVFSSTCATYGEPIETPIAETHPQQPINSYGETKLAVERALPHFERAYGIRWVALRYFNAAGADPDGEIGEDHSPEIHLIPRAIEAATRRPRRCRCSATTIRRRTAPACATTSTSPTWPTRTSGRSRRSSRRARPAPTISAPGGRTRCGR